MLAKDDPNIIFTGAIFGADKDTILRNAWVFCLPSSMEGLPISLLEGMSYGKVCIASDITANKEALGDSGIWVKKENAEDITCLLYTSNRIFNKFADEFYGWKFAWSLKPGDVVFLTNFGNVFFKVVKRKGVKVVHEKTEHPDVYSFKGFNVERYKREVVKVDGMFVISTALKD